jgi:hypothetical protein
MPLVEVVPHPQSDNQSIDTAINFYKALRRKPVLIRQEVPGFAANRLQAALCSEAYSLVNRGILSAEDLGLFHGFTKQRTYHVDCDRFMRYHQPRSALGTGWPIHG